MENPNKIKWKEEFLLVLPILVSIILFIYIGDTLCGVVVLFFIAVYSIIYLYVLGQKISKL
jgi:hypothetical protein